MSYEERRKELDEELKARGFNSWQRRTKVIQAVLDVLSEDKGQRFTDIYDADIKLSQLHMDIRISESRIERIKEEIGDLERRRDELQKFVDDLAARARTGYVIRGEDLVRKIRQEVDGIHIRFKTSFGLVVTSGDGVKEAVLSIIDRYLKRPESILDLLRWEDENDGK